MFTAIYNTVQSALSSDSPLPDREDTDGSRSDTDLPSYPSSQCSYNDSSSEFEADVEVKNIDGKVTKLLSGYGLINGDVYFSFDTVAGEYRPSVGDSVYAIIYRDKKTSGWRAKRVTLEEKDWGYADFPEDMVGIITKATRIETVINDILQCTHDSIVQGYRPHPGDWIQASTHKDPETGNTLVKDVRPLREQKIYGTISHIYVGYGFIDYRTYFAFSACQCGYIPEKGDKVIALCIEAKQKRGNWRAVSVELKREKQLPRPEDLIVGPLQSIKTDLIKDKCGIIITDKLDFALIANGKTKQIYFWIRNVGIGLQVLKGFTICNLHSEVTIDFPEIRNNGEDKTEGEKKEDEKEGKKEEIKTEEKPSKQIWILPGRAIQGTITIKPQNLGRFRELVTFDFGSFQIGRYIYMEVEDENMKLIRSHGGNRSRENSLQKFKDRYFNSQTSSAIYGVRPTRNFNWNTPVKLKRHPVPAELVQCVLDKREVESLIPQLQQSLCIKNYFIRFSALLHLEEIQMEIEIRKYDLERESLRKHGEFLSLSVNGLAEGRPSVLVGDKIILTPLDALPHTITYEGYVHEVHGEEVLLKFHPSFHEDYMAEEYHVTFTFSKTVLQRCHQAADMAENIGNRILFPSWKNIEVKPPQVSITFPESRQPVKATFRQPVVATRVASPAARPRRRGVTSNQSYLPRHSSSAGCQFVIPKFSTSSPPRSKQKGEKLVGEYFDKKLNPRQKIAVFRILQGQARPTPYILFGPPGTGKTVTVVESILQVHKHVRSSRILACTPSNSAADLLTSRLSGSGRVKQNDLVRLNSFRRLEDNIDDDIRHYCTDGQQLEVVAHHRIIVCTCSSAGMFFQLKLRPGHFTHIYIDEAGQAMEPECLIPVALATGDDSQIILAGDPMQLGPVLQSRQSLKLGLNQSLLERLMKRPVYLRDEKKFRDHGSYDPLLVTKLVDNYRSHECVLHIPSHLFYHNELVVKADESIRNRFKSWEQLPSKHNFPIIFHGIQGEELQEGNSPSWFNAAEAVQTLKYVQALLQHSEQTVEAQDCGIITPYRKQVEKIRLLLTSVGIDDIKVGSVEEFQGQEKPVIIISTVRSGEDYIGFDLRHKLGFLSNPKRFNVSVTRAQALLVIVGNPHVLAKDPKWLAMLTYCIKNDAYVGCQLPDLEGRDEMELIKLEQSFYDMPQPEESVEKQEELEKSDGIFVPQSEESVAKLEKMEKSDGILVPQPEGSVVKLEKVGKSDGILVPQPEESVTKLEKVEKSDGILVPQPEESVAKLEKVEKSDGILVPQSEESVAKLEKMEKSDGILVPQPEGSVVKLEKVGKSDGILVPQPEESVTKLEKVEKSDGILVPQPEESVAKLEKVEKSDGILVPQPEESVAKLEKVEKSDGILVPQPEESVAKLEKVEKSDGILVPQPEESVAKLEKVEKSDEILVPQPEKSVAKLEKVEKSDGILVPQPEKSVAKLEKVEKSDGILEVGELKVEMSQTNGDLTQLESKMSQNEDDIKISHQSLSNFLKDLGIIENSSETTVTETLIDISTEETGKTTKDNIKDSHSGKHHHLNSEPIPSSSNTSDELDTEKEKQSDVLFVGNINVSDQKVARDVVASEGQVNGQHKEIVTGDEKSQMTPKSASTVQGFKLEGVDVQGWKKIKIESNSSACCMTDGFDAVDKQVGRPVTNVDGGNEEAYDSKSVELNHHKVCDAPITTEHVEAEQQIKEYMTTTLRAQTRNLMSFANDPDIITPAAGNHVETRDLIYFENVSAKAVVTDVKSIIGDTDGSSVDHLQVSVDPLLVSVDPLLFPLIKIPQLDDRSSDVRICSDTSIQNWITDKKSDELSSSKINLCSTDDSGSVYLGNNKETTESCVKEDLKELVYFTSTPLFPKSTENLLGFEDERDNGMFCDSENNINANEVDVICDLDQSCNACSYDSSLQLSDIQYTDSSSSSQQQTKEISTAVGDLHLSVETSCSTSETNTSTSIECSLLPPSSFVCAAVWPNSDMRRLSDKNDHLYIDEQNNQFSNTNDTPLSGGREVEEECSRKQFIEMIKDETTTVPICNENDDLPDLECLLTERENVPEDFCLHDDDGPPPLIDLELEDDDGPPPLLWVNDIS